MTRSVEPYLLTRMGPQGPDERGSLYVLGPSLGPSYRDLVDENRCLRAELDELALVAAEVERLRQRVEDESRLRVEAQDRLSKCARVLATLSFTHPELRGLIDRARASIWPEDP